MVIEQKMSIYQTSRLLNINNATAKDIIRKYKKDGTVFVRKTDTHQLEPESSSSYHPHPVPKQTPVQESEPRQILKTIPVEPEAVIEGSRMDLHTFFMPQPFGVVFTESSEFFFREKLRIGAE